METHRVKKNVFFNISKKVFITKETYENNGIEAIVDKNRTLWLNKNNIGDGLKHTNLPVITRKYHSDYRKHRLEIGDEPGKEPNRIFLREDLALIIIKDCRTHLDEFKKGLEFNAYDVINTKEKTVLGAIMTAFEGGNM